MGRARFTLPDNSLEVFRKRTRESWVQENLGYKMADLVAVLSVFDDYESDEPDDDYLDEFPLLFGCDALL